MAIKKTQISITLDTELLQRLRAVALKRGEPLSRVLERVCINGVEDEEGMLVQLENPICRAILRAVTVKPEVLEFFSKLAGDELEPGEAEYFKERAGELMKAGAKRAAGKKKRKVRRGLAGA